MPTVSVIMPAYNVERYLGEAIESVLAQTYTDFELVIVDDGSTDNSRMIAERYRAEHPDRIVVVSQQNRGLAGARNTALGVASGRVFALLDSDDGWAPTFLESQMRVLDAHEDVAIVSGNAINRGGAEDGRPARPVPDPRPALDLITILRDETAVFIMSLFRREVVDRVGGFDEEFRTNEDYDFWIRAAFAGFGFLRNPEPLGFYRRHANSLSASDVRMLAGILRVYRKALLHCPAGSAAADVIVAQIRRFETELLAAEARDALDRGDMPQALAAVEQLWNRRGGLALGLFTHSLRHAPGVARWAYLRRTRARGRPL
jgi:glycosyltransferase involved in cell wall biosynthesis